MALFFAATGFALVVSLLLALLTSLPWAVVLLVGLVYGAGWFVYGWASTRDDPVSEWTWVLGLVTGATVFVPWLVGTALGKAIRARAARAR